ncbi:hypothetical protein LNP00_06470, partial [Fructobacillus sp. M158]|nr:hypothetical protein [Fructobacillus parabroussonetiae]
DVGIWAKHMCTRENELGSEVLTSEPEGPMMNGQLNPVYNIQAAVSNQMVIGYDVFQNPTDTRMLIPLVKKIKYQKSRH